MNYCKNFLLIAFVIFFQAPLAFSANRIWYEDCETTDFETHFLERQYGTNEATYWSDLLNDISQSSENPYAGSYSMQYNPALTRNPHAQMASGPSNYGNTSNFEITSNNRYWYFRWYQRWENSTYTGYNKLWYLGGYGDYYYICKSGPSSFIYVVRSEIGGTILSNGWPSHNESLDDMQWHKMEIFLDVGTRGNSNGSTWIKVDGRKMLDISGLAFTSQSRPIPGVMWPSNYSGTISGSQNIWLDELEVYELSGPNDIPGGEAPPSTDNNPTISIVSPNSGNSYETNSEIITLQGIAYDDNGLTDVSWVSSDGQGIISNNLNNWSTDSITLQEGTNQFTVTATDTVGQMASDTLTVTYNPSAPVLPESKLLWDASVQTGDQAWSDSTAIWCVRALVEGSSISQAGEAISLGFMGRNSSDYLVSA